MSNANSPRHAFVASKYRHLHGCRPDRPDHRDLALALPLHEEMPAEVDLAGYVTRIEDQADLGSCSANATTSAMEALAKKLQQPMPELSRLFAYYYARKIDGTPATEDAGATMRAAMKSIATFGVPPETTWPYSVDAFSKAPSYTAIRAARAHRVIRYYRCQTLDVVRRVIADGFTVVGGISVPENMLGDACAQTGRVQLPEPTEGFEGGHAIHFVGYKTDSQAPGGGWVKFQNSWGTGWGDGGYGYLPWQFFTAGLAWDCWTIRQES